MREGWDTSWGGWDILNEYFFKLHLLVLKTYQNWEFTIKGRPQFHNFSKTLIFFEKHISAYRIAVLVFRNWYNDMSSLTKYTFLVFSAAFKFSSSSSTYSGPVDRWTVIACLRLSFRNCNSSSASEDGWHIEDSLPRRNVKLWKSFLGQEPFDIYYFFLFGCFLFSNLRFPPFLVILQSISIHRITLW